MTQLELTAFLLRYWPIILGVSMLLIGLLAGLLLGRIGRGYDDGWKAGYSAHKEQRREIAERVREARRSQPDTATQVLPQINPHRPVRADQTVILRNPRRNP